MNTPTKENIQTHGNKREQSNNVLKNRHYHNNNNKITKSKIIKTNTKENIQTHRNEQEKQSNNIFLESNNNIMTPIRQTSQK